MSSKAKKSVNSKKKNQGSLEHEAFQEVLQYVVAAFVLVLVIAVPMYLYEGFSNVGEAKYLAYKWVAGVGLVLTSFLFIYYQVITKGEDIKRMYNTDYFNIGFILMCIISAIAGGNFAECIWGYEGWYMGIISQITFVLIFLYVSRYGRFRNVMVTFMLGTAAIVFLIGVLNKMMIDPLGNYYLGTEYEIADNYKNTFLSTMGQVSWYSSYVATILPLGIGIFWYAKKRSTIIWSGLFTLVGFLTLTSQDSDSAYMALLGFMMVFYWFSTGSIDRMERFFRIVVLFVASTRVMKLLLIIHPNDRLVLGSLSNFAINNNLMWVLLIVFGAIWGAFYFWKVKDKKYHAGFWNFTRYVFLGLIVLVLIGSTVILIMSAKGTTPEWLKQYTWNISYLNWSEEWGNFRGRSWTVDSLVLQKMGIVNIIFGVGPDGYAMFTYDVLGELLDAWFPGLTLCNAHNEWLNALINYGILGFIAYTGIFITSIRNFGKRATANPAFVGYIACIVSYMAHNFFCYQQVCCTPFLFVIIGIGTCMFREEVKDEPYKSLLDIFKKKQETDKEIIK